MFQQPTRSTKVITPPPNLDLDARYVFKVLKLEDQGVSKFADPAKGENFHNIQWEFNIAHADSKTLVYDPEGQPWTFIDWTTSKIGKNPTNGMVAKARLWIEAFLGHAVEDDEITADTPNHLVGRYASGFFEEKEVKREDGTSYKKLQIMRLSPYKGGESKPAAPPPPPPVAATTSDLPF